MESSWSCRNSLSRAEENDFAMRCWEWKVDIENVNVLRLRAWRRSRCYTEGCRVLIRPSGDGVLLCLRKKLLLCYRRMLLQCCRTRPLLCNRRMIFQWYSRMLFVCSRRILLLCYSAEGVGLIHVAASEASFIITQELSNRGIFVLILPLIRNVT